MLISTFKLFLDRETEKGFAKILQNISSMAQSKIWILGYLRIFNY